MSKLRHFLPLFVILLSLGGCKKEQTYRIGVSQCSEDDWRLLMNEEIDREIMFHPEATVVILSADDSSERQIAHINYFIDHHFDLIIAAPNEADALTPVIAKAWSEGIPVLVFDRDINGHCYTAFQGADNAGIGREAARYAATKLLPSGGTAIEIMGLPGSTPAAERSRGFREALDGLGSAITIVGAAPANWNDRLALHVADSLLALYPDVDLIYAHNDRMAVAAADAAEARGLRPYIIGIDGAPAIGMKAVKEGKIDATFFYPTEGDQLIQTGLAILNGEPYEENLLIPASPAIDKSNVDLLLQQTKTIEEETNQLRILKSEMEQYWSRHNSQTAFLIASIAVLVLVCILLFVVLRNFWQNRRHHAELMEKNRQLEEQSEHEKQLNRRLEAATQSKLVFFTNVSHDLRTPLTLIAEPVEQLSRAANLSPGQHTLMRIADKNVKILRRLINQILDFRKFENDKLTLNPEETHPGPLARDWAEAFRALANKKHVRLDVDIDLPDDFSMALDVEKVERVVFNLLSNAFKFTPVKGRVKFSLALEDNTLVIKVADTGRGISEEHMKNIFSRFYQVDKVRPEGSGIGLNLVKNFVELHGGMITVESRVGEGTVFTVSLPVSHVEQAASAEMLRQSVQTVREYADSLDTVEEPLPDVREENAGGKPLLLVIDDNEDVRLLVKELLKDEYTVVSASDGREGIRLAMRYVPDAIICDVMMPGLDGMETCAAIKNEISTSHIPVLMLTACSLDEQRAQGYESGADGFMSKPFNSDVLRARLFSLLANRRRLLDARKEAVPASPVTPEKEAETPARPDLESEFYKKFTAVVSEEMGNMDLSVDALAERMGMGRSQFYRKVKALTGLSPVELLRDMRLKKARRLLRTTDKTVSEIAYEVGFSTPAYFTKCYREVYSETPSALRDRLRG